MRFAAAIGENHEAIGSAFVGAAIAFGLGAAFYDRVEELGPRGARMREVDKRLEAPADRELSGADPAEREEVVSSGRHIFIATRSAAG